MTESHHARRAVRRLKILVPLAALWLLAGAYVHGVWAPRAAAQLEASVRESTASALRPLEAGVTDAVKRSALGELAPTLEAALAAQSWRWIEVRERSGQSLRREARPAMDARGPEVERPLTDGAVVIGWLSAGASVAPALAEHHAQLRELDLLLLVGLVATLLLGNALIHRVIRRPLERVAASAAALKGEPGHAVAEQADIIIQLGEDLVRADQLSHGREHELAEASERRRKTEARLLESEERYMLAVRGVDDGLWEWDLKGGRMYFSPRWKSMLGYPESEIGDEIAEWHERIHPEERAGVLAALQAHLDDPKQRFERDYRLRHRDGRYRWVMARATALRSASGRPYRVLGLNTDITARKRAEQVLESLAKGLSTQRGEAFFAALVRDFARTLEVEFAFVAECVDSPPTRVRQLACWRGQDHVATKEYALAGTPCKETVGDGKVCLIESGVGQRYPREKGWESYLGIPIADGEGRVIGHLACFSARPLEGDLPVNAIFSLFALRAGLELEREQLRRAGALTPPASP